MIWLVTAALLVYLILLGWFSLGLVRLRRQKSVHHDQSPAITVIIPVRNEEKSIRSCLESIWSGSNPAFIRQIVVVDDESNDETVRIVTDLKTTIPVLICVPCSQFPQFNTIRSPKKRAVRIGLEVALTDWIALTDGDTRVPANWLEHMCSKLNPETRLVGGPVEFNQPDQWFFKWLHAEFAGLMLVAAGSIGFNRPTLINGANMLLSRKGFFESGGYGSDQAVISGDDEMLMHRLHRNQPGSVAYCLSREAVVTTDPPGSTGEWIHQRLRWASKSTDYTSLPYRLFLASFWFIHAIFLTGFIWSLVTLNGWLFLLLQIKTLADLGFLLTANRLFLSKPIHWTTPIWSEWLQTTYMVLTGLAGLRKRFSWKGRNW
ncbi:MAG: glycosyltransferase [Bacteroidetes bacterium]|nr:glycosyltransferase [Bacteroidota bacterium]